MYGGGGALREGVKVEARYRGKSMYYPGVIRRENRDGTFDVDYDDVRSIVDSSERLFIITRSRLIFLLLRRARRRRSWQRR